MDKETLSNYGWIVICVLVLAVMIALATPFGKFISNAVQNTTQGLFDVNQKALNQTGLLTEEIPDQKFDVPDGNGATEETPALVPGATLADGTFLTWDALIANGYNVDYTTVGTYVCVQNGAPLTPITNLIIPDGVKTIDSEAFVCSELASITIPDSVTTIKDAVFNFVPVTNITFNGTVAQWNAIQFDPCWDITLSETTVHCLDGDVTIG